MLNTLININPNCHPPPDLPQEFEILKTDMTSLALMGLSTNINKHNKKK